MELLELIVVVKLYGDVLSMLRNTDIDDDASVVLRKYIVDIVVLNVVDDDDVFSGVGVLVGFMLVEIEGFTNVDATFAEVGSTLVVVLGMNVI